VGRGGAGAVGRGRPGPEGTPAGVTGGIGRWPTTALPSRGAAPARPRTPAGRGENVPIEVSGLRPGREYWTDPHGNESLGVGHTRTAPATGCLRADSSTTCANFRHGYSPLIGICRGGSRKSLSIWTITLRIERGSRCRPAAVRPHVGERADAGRYRAASAVQERPDMKTAPRGRALLVRPGTT